MEGERAFVQELEAVPGGAALLAGDARLPYRYDVGGGVHASAGWEPLRPAGLHDLYSLIQQLFLEVAPLPSQGGGPDSGKELALAEQRAERAEALAARLEALDATLEDERERAALAEAEAEADWLQATPASHALCCAPEHPHRVCVSA